MVVRPKILVSSSVHDKEDLLEQIDATLTGLGYDVWISKKGTFPIDSHLTNFDNCLNAVRSCDLFLGIISGYYGSGKDGGHNSITHQELAGAIELDKQRWLLVHEHVLVVRRFVKRVREFEVTYKTEVCSRLQLKTDDPISDIRVVTMYEEAIRSGKALAKRTGNWVQPYKTTGDVLRFVGAQLGDPSKYIVNS